MSSGVWTNALCLCVALQLLAAVSAAAFQSVDIRSESDSPTIIAVQACAGLDNREGSKTYVVGLDQDNTWLERLGLAEQDESVDTTAFLRRCLTQYGQVRYNSSRPELFPYVLTIAGTHDGVPADDTLMQKLFPAGSADEVSVDDVKMVFDCTTRNWSDERAAFDDAADVSLALTRSLCMQQQDRILAGTLVDYIVKERLFVTYLEHIGVWFTKNHRMLKEVVDRSNWERPVKVYGYNSQDVIFGGDLFEAETNNINVLGQIASANSRNLAFLSADGSLPKPLKQSPSEQVAYDPSKAYVALVYGDMDNIDFVQSFGAEHMEERVELCKDETKCFPLTWTISPNLVDFSPAVIDWYYRQSGDHDKFIMPPSGNLYSYPGMFPEKVKEAYVNQMNHYAHMMNTSGSIHWEWLATWSLAYKNYFPKFIGGQEGQRVRGFFLNNVPWPIPILNFLGKTYKFFGDPSKDESVVAFKPAFNWQEDGGGGIKGGAAKISGMINKFKKGSVQYVYVIQNTTFKTLTEMVGLLDEHVELVTYDQLIDLAVQREAHRSR